MSIIDQVAGLKCPFPGLPAQEHKNAGFECPTCQGTGLRFPSLSRECQIIHTVFEDGGANSSSRWTNGSCAEVGCTGRIPDVTEGKLLEILRKEGAWQICLTEVGKAKGLVIECMLSVYPNQPGGNYVSSEGPTLLEALAAALVATE